MEILFSFEAVKNRNLLELLVVLQFPNYNFNCSSPANIQLII